MSSEVQICSGALVRLGAESISSFNELSTGPLCAEIFPDVKLRVYTAAPWRRILVKSGLLNRLTTFPKSQYQFEYQLPPDMLTGLPRTVWDNATQVETVNNVQLSSPGGNSQFTNFDIFGLKLMTNAEEILVDYVKDLDPELLPPHINQLMIYAMAAELALAVTDQQNTADTWFKIAWGTPEQNGKGGYFKEAQRIDSQGHPSQAIKNYPLTAVRHGGL